VWGDVALWYTCTTWTPDERIGGLLARVAVGAVLGSRVVKLVVEGSYQVVEPKIPGQCHSVSITKYRID